MSNVVLEEKWLRCKDALQMIGVSRMTLYRLVAAKKIRCYHTPVGNRYKHSELTEFMTSGENNGRV